MVPYTCWIVCAVCDAIIYAHKDNIYRFYILFLSEMISYILMISAEYDRCIICTLFILLVTFWTSLLTGVLSALLFVLLDETMGRSERDSLISCSDCVEWLVILSRIASYCVVQPYSERCYPTWAPRIFLTPSNSSSTKSWIVIFSCYEPLLRLNDGWMQNRILRSVQIWRRECHDKHEIDYLPQLTIRNRILLSQKNYHVCTCIGLHSLIGKEFLTSGYYLTLA